MKQEPFIISNILKQINSKLGGDLFNIELPKEISKDTMLLGIDVCNDENFSYFGFCATINSEMS